jgi:hypothetical protein
VTRFAGPAKAVVLACAVLSPSPAAAGDGYLEAGDWFVRREGGPFGGCTLGTGGYDPASEQHEPILTLSVRSGDVSLSATAASALGLDALRRMDLRLRVEGGRPLSVPAVPSAITETPYERSISLRPRFAGGDRAGQMRRLVSAMRGGERLVVELGGRALEPAFSLRGFDAVWAQADLWCGGE